jgi:hypothetical protein
MGQGRTVRNAHRDREGGLSHRAPVYLMLAATPAGLSVRPSPPGVKGIVKMFHMEHCRYLFAS